MSKNVSWHGTNTPSRSCRRTGKRSARSWCGGGGGGGDVCAGDGGCLGGNGAGGEGRACGDDDGGASGDTNGGGGVDVSGVPCGHCSAAADSDGGRVCSTPRYHLVHPTCIIDMYNRHAP